MIRVTLPLEPDDFNDDCRVPGNQWLAAHADPTEDPPNRWRDYTSVLRAGFNNRCGYLAIWDLNGTVDHYLSVDNHRHLAYEWTNYHYATGWLNSSKQNLDQQVLDPLQVRDEWFEMDLASLHMRLTAAVPARIRPIAEFTLRRLKLDYGPKIIDIRAIYWDLFQTGGMDLGSLDREIPLMATAVRLERLLTHLATHPSVSRQEIADLCDTTVARATELARAWRLAGHLQSLGRGRNVRYRSS
jgi:hypothetical protein